LLEIGYFNPCRDGADFFAKCSACTEFGAVRRENQGKTQNQSRWHPNQTKNMKKYFTAALIQKQNKITLTLKFVIIEERKLRRFSP